MVRVVPLFVLVMLATVLMIALVSAFVVCMKFIFSDKRRTFGLLFAGCVLAIISFIVLSSAYTLNRRYARAEYHAQLEYELSRRQAEMSQQVDSELRRHRSSLQHQPMVVEQPLPPEPIVTIQSIGPDNVVVSLNAEHPPESFSQSEEFVEGREINQMEAEVTDVEGVIDQAEAEVVDVESEIEEKFFAEKEADSVGDVTESDEFTKPSDDSEMANHVALDSQNELDRSLAKISTETPIPDSTSLEDKGGIPNWFVNWEHRMEWKNVPAKVVKSSKGDPRLRRLELRLETKYACVDRAMEMQDELGINVSSIQVTDEMIQACQRDSFTVSQPLPGGGYEDTVYQLLVFDESFRGYVQDAVKNHEITNRLQTTAVLSGIVLTSVTFLYGAFSFLAYWRRPKSA